MKKDLYRFICIADSVPQIFSPSPFLGYLHIHILQRCLVPPLNKLKTIEPSEKGKKGILYQWGALSDKYSKTRSEKVSVIETMKFGQVGIGSFARGSEKNGSFVGGGEGFLFANKTFRISKGNEVFPCKGDQKYWIAQVADFNNCKIISHFNNKKIIGRRALQKLIQSECVSSYVATFDAEFEGRFFARSNGIFPEDLNLVSDPLKSIFTKSVKGGHLLGGSEERGDLEVVGSEAAPDFTLTIKSDLLLQPITNCKYKAATN